MGCGFFYNKFDEERTGCWIRGKRDIGRVSEGEVIVMVSRSGRMWVLFQKEGKVQLEKQELIRAVRCERNVGEEIFIMD